MFEQLGDFLTRRRAVVRVHSNLALYSRRAMLLLALLLLFAFGYGVGIKDFLRLGAIDALEFNALSDEHRQTLGMHADLEKINRDLSVNSQIDQKAQEFLREQLVEMQVEIKRLNDELLFYRHLHESDKLVEGLRVQSFELRPVANTQGQFRYRSIISFFSASERNSFFEGYYDIYVEVPGATADDKPERIRVTPTNRSKRKYKFKLIHTVKGEFKLEPGIVPMRVFFRLQPKSSRLEAVEKVYSFEELSQSGRQY